MGAAVVKQQLKLFASGDRRVLMQSTISARELLEPVDLQAYDLLADAQVV